MKATATFSFRLLFACLLVLAGTCEALAWDTTADANGKYDGIYDRPTFFPEWSQPSTWPNAMYVLCDVHKVSATGKQVPSYEIAVYDQNGNLRHCNRSLPKDSNLCVLTIRGEEGDVFHFKVIYGNDFTNPEIVDVDATTLPFKTNAQVGVDSPYILVIPSSEIEAIGEVKRSAVGANNTYRSLLGIRVTHPRQGVYIRGNKKVLVRNKR